jgi:hypothetical protein
MAWNIPEVLFDSLALLKADAKKFASLVLLRPFYQQRIAIIGPLFTQAFNAWVGYMEKYPPMKVNKTNIVAFLSFSGFANKAGEQLQTRISGLEVH